MNRKHNPLVALVALVALLLLAVLLLCAGCSETSAAAPEEPESSLRFTVERQETNLSGCYVHVITDTETGAQYLFFMNGSLSGLTVLQPAPEEVTAS